MLSLFKPCFQVVGPVLVLLGLGLLGPASARAQQTAAARDTSFTTHSAYVKALKQNPGISIARPPVPASIRARYGVTYVTLPGGRALKLDVFYPRAKRRQRFPAVLIIHGGGWRSGDRAQHVPLAQQLAARGYVTVTAEYRLSGEAKYPAAVQDLKTALRWLCTQTKVYPIDTTRVAVWGFSAGGQLAALVGTTNGNPQFEAAAYASRSSRVHAIIDADGILAFIHPESGEGDDSKSTSAATYWLGSPKAAHPELWQQASALTYINAQTPPMLFINSGVDRMHAGRDDVMRQLTALGIYTEMHRFPEAPHPFVLFNPWFEPTLNYTAAFLQRVFPAK